VLWAVAVLTAGLTSFYMFRLWFMTFFGERRADADLGDAHGSTSAHAATPAGHGHDDDHGHAVHESPWVMLGPLVVLAVGCIVSGWVGWSGLMRGHTIDHFLQPAIQTPAEVAAATGGATPPSGEQAESSILEGTLVGFSLAAATTGLFFAWLFYYKRPHLPDRITARIHGIYLLVLHKYYVDEGYGAIFVKPLLALSTVVFWRGVDQGLIDGMVNGAGEVSKEIGGGLRRMQSGNIRSYAAWVAAGGAAVIAFLLWHNLVGVGK